MEKKNKHKTISAAFLKNRAKIAAAIEQMREMLLANLAMLAEIPAQTFHEQQRAEFLLARFTESGIPEAKVDNLHNVIASSDKSPTRNKIVVCAHMDNQFDMNTDQNISISEDCVYGAGVADDNLALAVLLTLPDIVKKLNLKCDLNLLATTRYHGRGDFGGIKHFIGNNPDIGTLVEINGLSLGSISYFSLSRVRCDIKCELEPTLANSSWLKMTDSSAIMVANEIISSLYSIPLPKRPKSLMNIGMISGGERYSTVSCEAMVNLELLSEDDNFMDNIIEEIKNHCIDIGAKHGVKVTADFFGRQRAHNFGSGHYLAKSALEIQQELKLHSKVEYSNSQIAVSLENHIPSVSLGLARGYGGSSNRSYVQLDSINQGIEQLIGLIMTLNGV